jgi:hypothetical protein
MGRPPKPCGDCAYYLRVHTSGPPTYGTCLRWARHASVHWNEHGCQEWVMHAFAYQLACGDYVIERDGKRLGRYARDNVLAQAVRFGLDPIDVWGRDPETGLVIWDVIALGMTNVRPR